MTVGRETQYLYVIAHPKGWRKIGRTNDPVRRLKQHQRNSADLLIGEAICPSEDAVSDERKAHLELHERQITGEWFDVSCDWATKAIERATGSISYSFDETQAVRSTDRKQQASSNAPKAADPHRHYWATRPMMERIRDRLSDGEEILSITETYERLGDDLTPWVEELRAQKNAFGHDPFEPSRRWIEVIQGRMKRTAESRRRHGA